MKVPSWWPWKKSVFKHITINLRGPICNCDEPALSWATPDGALLIKCKVCGVSLLIPANQFSANFTFETPYPGKGTSKKDPVLKALDGGKVLPMRAEPKKNEDPNEE